MGVAADEFGIRGRPTNTSRIALLTGIGRKEVKRLRDRLAEAAPAEPNRTGDATRVLSGWHLDPDFLDEAGRPIALPADAAEPSFESLCARHAGDIPVSALRKELERVGAIRTQPGSGLIEVTRRYFMPVQADPTWVLNAGSVLADLGNTIQYNHGVAEGEPTRFLGRASEERIDPRAAAELRALLEERGQALLEEVDRWLTEHRLEEEDAGDRGVRLGVGVFMIQDEQ